MSGTRDDSLGTDDDLGVNLATEPGTRVGRYVVIGSAGSGGMGIILLAYDPQLDRRVALKILRVARLGADAERRLQREAQALARLSHPNVVPVYDVGTWQQHAFVAMEYVQGVTLSDWLRERRSWQEIVAVVGAAGRGLAAAHRAGLVHRDFKPSNVLIGNDGRVRVVDFGLARSVEDVSGEQPPAPPDGATDTERRQLPQVTRNDHVVGTPSYMAPEQEANDAFDERADQYSFGVTLWRALYGQLPFGEIETGTAPTKDAHGGRRRSLPAEPAGHGVPAWLHKIVVRALSDDPKDRFPSMDQLLAALERDPAQSARRWLTISAIVAFAAVAGLSWWRGQAQQQARCQSGASRVAELWSPARAARVHQAFSASGLAYAGALADALARQLDDYAARWSTMHRDACEATWVRGEQSQEALDLRMACLDDRLRELAAVTDGLGRADDKTIKRAPDIAQGLTPVETCGDVVALRAQPPRPRDEAARRAVDALQGRVAEVEARYLVGKAKEGAELGESLLTQARATGYLPLESAIEHWLARCYSDLHDEGKAASHFGGAFADALAAHEDHLAAHVAARLAQEYLFASAPTHLQQYQQWAQIAEAAGRRAGGDVSAELILARVRCISLFDTGQIADRVRCIEGVVKQAGDANRLTEWDVSMLGLAHVDMGDFDEGVRWLERGVQLSVAQLGPKHPRTIENRGFLCYAYEELGQPERAREVCSAALHDAAQGAGDQTYLQTRLRLYLAQALRWLGRQEEARQTATEALSAHQEDFDPDLQLALGGIDLAQGRAAAAVTHMRQALALDQKSLAADHPNVVRDREALGEALLASGDLAAARAMLEAAARSARTTQLSALAQADLDFALARAVSVTEPARSLTLARGAAASYRRRAPATPRYREQLAKIDALVRAAAP